MCSGQHAQPAIERVRVQFPTAVANFSLRFFTLIFIYIGCSYQVAYKCLGSLYKQIHYSVYVKNADCCEKCQLFTIYMYIMFLMKNCKV